MEDNKPKWKKGLAIDIIAGVIGITAIYFSTMSPSRLEEPKDRVRPTQPTREQLDLESKIGKMIYFAGMDDNQQKNAISNMSFVYDLAKKDFDNFARNFSYAKDVTFYPNDGKRPLAHTTDNGHLEFSEISLDSVVHESGHLWHINVSNEFDREWLKISGNYYVSDWENSSEQDIIRNGAVRNYAVKCLEEDVTCTQSFVYHLNSEGCIVSGIPMNKPFPTNSTVTVYEKPLALNKTYPKIIQKIKLLEKYGAISSRESSNAVLDLEDYSRLKTSFQ